MENGNSSILILILLIVAFGGTFWVRNLLAKRAARQVVRIFYQNNALGIDSAKTLRELGLERADFLQRMVKPRDYKQNVLQVLITKGIVQATADGKLYLVEEKLDERLRYNRSDLL